MRDILSAAINFIERQLRENAHLKGLIVQDGLRIRIYYSPPFVDGPTAALIFDVSVEDRLVRILEVRV